MVETAAENVDGGRGKRMIAMLRDKVRQHGVAWTLRRAAFHLWQVAARRPESGYSWQLLTDALPVLEVVNVEITTYCNLRCAGCERTIHAEKGQWNNSHLSVDHFRRIIDQLPTAVELIPQGIGEPALHPHLPELIQIAAESGKFNEITLTTHGMARDIDYFCGLFENGLAKLYVSVDSLDPELASRLRTGTDVEVLKERIQTLASRFPGRVSARVTVGRENVEHFSDLLAELAGLGCQLGVAAHPYTDSGIDSGCLSDEENIAFAHRAAELAAGYENIAFQGDGFIPSHEVCQAPWRSPSIKVNGDLTPCCQIMYNHVFTWGNVIERSFDDVWKDPQTEQWRADFQRHSPAICEGCPWYVMRKPALDHDQLHSIDLPK